MRSFLALVVLSAAAGRAQPRLITLDDMHRFQTVGDPRCSPEGNWIAYTLSTVDAEGDKRDTDIWMVSVDGKETVRVTTSPESETSPRWSPDGRFLAFLSSRPGAGKVKGNQVWLLDRRGGEARRLTELKGRLSSFEWAPDGKRLALVFREEEAPPKDDKQAGQDAAEKPKPVVIDRYSFKRDGAGYLYGERRERIYLYDIATNKAELLTTENYDESSPVWSPDGRYIAFVSNRAPDADRVPNPDIWIAEAKPGSTPRRLTSFTGSDTSPVFSPDGKWIAYLRGSEHQLREYNMNRLALIPVSGGEPKLLAANLDRGVSAPQFTPGGGQIEFLVTDDMNVYPARVNTGGGAVERLVAGKLVVTNLHRGGACVAALVSTDKAPAEVHVLDGGALRKVTGHNDALVSQLKLVEPEELRIVAGDGNEVHALLFKPHGYAPGSRVPLLLRIHGGPNAQDQHSFRLEEQIFAAHGYAVLNVNYRGSSGRGEQYTVSIAGDWGNKEVIDLQAAVDYVVKLGVADPNRLGVGGWSYGGILTNYLIARDQRFKAATSGAGVSFPLAFYGHDQYIRQYDVEIGPPWEKGLDRWLKISYPFLEANRIKTPTLFLCGDKDFNVPLLGSEQMYQALRNVGTETQLVIYPNENHGITRPSFQLDRMKRYLDWYGKYLKPE
jgi:dipeptidyl aminopeptidase/acylaminoacyl peptidase